MVDFGRKHSVRAEIPDFFAIQAKEKGIHYRCLSLLKKMATQKEGVKKIDQMEQDIAKNNKALSELFTERKEIIESTILKNTFKKSLSLFSDDFMEEGRPEESSNERRMKKLNYPN